MWLSTSGTTMYLHTRHYVYDQTTMIQIDHHSTHHSESGTLYCVQRARSLSAIITRKSTSTSAASQKRGRRRLALSIEPVLVATAAFGDVDEQLQASVTVNRTGAGAGLDSSTPDLDHYSRSGGFRTLKMMMIFSPSWRTLKTPPQIRFLFFSPLLVKSKSICCYTDSTRGVNLRLCMQGQGLVKKPSEPISQINDQSSCSCSSCRHYHNPSNAPTP